jgi:hypothetical protein
MMLRYSLAGTLTLTWAEVVDVAAPILIGGGSLKAVDIAARWATQWNGTGDHAVIAERIAWLREREAVHGRAGQVETSVMRPALPAGLPALLDRLAEIGVQRIVLPRRGRGIRASWRRWPRPSACELTESAAHPGYRRRGRSFYSCMDI